jgi:hypothetical protein
MIENAKCPSCRIDLVIETRAAYNVKTFKFPSGIKVDCPEIHCGMYGLREINSIGLNNTCIRSLHAVQFADKPDGMSHSQAQAQ